MTTTIFGSLVFYRFAHFYPKLFRPVWLTYPFLALLGSFPCFPFFFLHQRFLPTPPPPREVVCTLPFYNFPSPSLRFRSFIVFPVEPVSFVLFLLVCADFPLVLAVLSPFMMWPNCASLLCQFFPFREFATAPFLCFPVCPGRIPSQNHCVLLRYSANTPPPTPPLPMTLPCKVTTTPPTNRSLAEAFSMLISLDRPLFPVTSLPGHKLNFPRFHHVMGMLYFLCLDEAY